MAHCEKRLILASGSPRRRELLEKFSLPFEILPACGEEHAESGLSPEETVIALARAKAREVAARVGDSSAVILAADTVVECDGRILGKPHGEAGAREMLSALSGREHRVWSGLCVREGERERVAAEATKVFFRPLREEELTLYIQSGEPLDKAGAYGYQGLAGAFVERIEGDYYNVIGLPLCRLGELLREFDISLL